MNTLISYLLSAPAILLSLTVHEVSHGYTAKLLGDETAARQGRLSLNPLKHLDPIGTILLFIARFGWAKPVPINPLYFRGNRNRGVLLVSVAGPASNLVLSLISALLLKVAQLQNLVGEGYAIYNSYLGLFLILMIQINIGLAVFNLIPIPPLDGSKILASLLPPQQRNKMYEIEKYGFVILIIILYFGGNFINPIVGGIMNLEFVLFGIT